MLLLAPLITSSIALFIWHAHEGDAVLGDCFACQKNPALAVVKWCVPTARGTLIAIIFDQL